MTDPTELQPGYFPLDMKHAPLYLMAHQNGTVGVPFHIYDWHEVRKVQHYYLNVDAMTRPMQAAPGQRRVVDRGFVHRNGRACGGHVPT